jgi:hypothetical protein
VPDATSCAEAYHHLVFDALGVGEFLMRAEEEEALWRDVEWLPERLLPKWVMVVSNG